MTARELIIELLNDPDIDIDREIALATKDGAFENHEYAMFHIKEITTDYITLLLFDDIRHRENNNE